MKIGRNSPCPCGSGLKYKKCCYGNADRQPSEIRPPEQITLSGTVTELQETAARKEKVLKELGVFILFSTEEGDAWLLETTDMDGVQVADHGEKIDVEIEENSETIEINWSHSFSIKNKKFITTSYADRTEKQWEGYPAHAIFAAIKRIRKRFPKELLDSIHLDEEEVSLSKQAS